MPSEQILLDATGILAETVEQPARNVASQIITIPGWATELDFICQRLTELVADLPNGDVPQPEQTPRPAGRLDELLQEMGEATEGLDPATDISPAESNRLFARVASCGAAILAPHGITVEMVYAAVAARAGEILHDIASGDPDMVVARYGDILSAESRKALLLRAIDGLKASGVTVDLLEDGAGGLFLALGNLEKAGRIPEIVRQAAGEAALPSGALQASLPRCH